MDDVMNNTETKLMQYIKEHDDVERIPYLAYTAKINLGRFNDICDGLVPATAEEKLRIAEAFRVDPDKLFGDE